MNEQDGIDLARSYFLTEQNMYGCAEATFITLKEVFGLPEASDSSAALGLNGGVAYSGGICGALSGAALAIGMLAGQRIDDHKRAKRVARGIIARLMDEFQEAYGSVDCRDLIGQDIRDEAEHRSFIESGIWRTRCMGQIEFSIKKLAVLGDEEGWEQIFSVRNTNDVVRLS